MEYDITQLGLQGSENQIQTIREGETMRTRSNTSRPVSARKYKKLLTEYNELMVDRNKLFRLLDNSVNLTRCKFCNEYNKAGWVCNNCYQDEPEPNDTIFNSRLVHFLPLYIQEHIGVLTRADEAKIVALMKSSRLDIMSSIEKILIDKKLIKNDD